MDDYYNMDSQLPTNSTDPTSNSLESATIEDKDTSEELDASFDRLEDDEPLTEKSSGEFHGCYCLVSKCERKHIRVGSV